jgi:glycosyltransferase involved in cell wall biosynthesis
MKLAVDALFLRPGRVGGAEFMLYSLLRALAAAGNPDDVVEVLLPEDARPTLPSLPENFRTTPVRLIGNRFLTSELQFARSRADVALFSNYYTPLSIRRTDTTAVTVVHDLQYRTFPQYFSPQKRLFQNVALRATCARADRVVAISAFTAQELQRFRPSAESRISVIPNPIDWDRFAHPAPPPCRNVFRDRFFLLPAAQYPHKNIATVVEAFSSFRRDNPNVDLVLTGQVPSGLHGAHGVRAVREEYGVTGLGHVPDDVLAWLYQHTTAVLMPSLYEGFGLPTVEALGLGTPVIHSGRTALSEVTRGLGLIVDDPLSPDQWAAAMHAAADGRLPRPSSGDTESIRHDHAPSVIGAHYWALLRTCCH